MKRSKKSTVYTIDKGNEDLKLVIDNIKKIEGPVSYYILEPLPLVEKLIQRSAPEVMIFGDIHEGRYKCKKCVAGSGCYSFYRTPIKTNSGFNYNVIPFIQKINNITKKYGLVFDFFIEYWSSIKERIDVENIPENEIIKRLRESNYDVLDKSSLYDFISNIKDCIPYKSKICLYDKKIRFHMVDVRRITDEKNKIENFFFKIYECFQDYYYTLLETDTIINEEEIELELRELEKSDNEYDSSHETNSELSNVEVEEMKIQYLDDFLTNLEEIYNEINIQKKNSSMLKNLILNYDMEEYLQNPVVKRHSKVYHELEKLPKDLRNILVKGIQSLIDEENDKKNIDFNFDLLDFNFFNSPGNLKREQFTSENIYYIMNRIFYIIAKMVDLYTVSRMLKNPKEARFSNMAFIYLGDVHSRTIKKLLSQTGLYKITKEKNSIKNKHFVKCLDFD